LKQAFAGSQVRTFESSDRGRRKRADGSGKTSPKKPSNAPVLGLSSAFYLLPSPLDGTFEPVNVRTFERGMVR